MNCEWCLAPEHLFTLMRSQTVQHVIPMLSLAARNSKQQVKHWHDVSFTNNLQRLPGKRGCSKQARRLYSTGSKEPERC
eukprot:617453-Pelagomonas_calceolata.AAC.6